MESHVRDLESRKRAPLYQKKQEEELRVATEKAAEAEARAQEAEAKAKELKVCCCDLVAGQGGRTTSNCCASSHGIMGQGKTLQRRLLVLLICTLLI